MTPIEKRLWTQLRGRRFSGFKFRRQTPVAGYIVDFYCAQARLILELDGASHVVKETADSNRERVLEAKLGAAIPLHQPLAPKGRGR
jgi:very-short-patch-repair endonuclease